MFRIVQENLPSGDRFDDDSIIAEVRTVVVRLCGGARAEMEASCIVKGFKANSASVIQVLLCSTLQLAVAG